MANRYSSRSAYNSFLINTVTVTADYTVSIMQTGTLFLIDASVADSPLTSLDISLPAPSHPGMYFKFMWSTVSAREVNIQLQSKSDSFSGFIVRHPMPDPGGAFLDASSDGTIDRLKYTKHTHPGSWLEAVSDGTRWVVYGDHYGVTVDAVTYDGMAMHNDG